jgi:hypothetical protein
MTTAERDASTRTRAGQRRAHLSRTLRLDDSLRNNVPVRLPSGLTSLFLSTLTRCQVLEKRHRCGGSIEPSSVERHAFASVCRGVSATRRDIVRLVLRKPLRVTVIGLILGIPGLYAIMRAVAALLVEVKPFDLATIAARGIGLMAIADVRFLLMCPSPRVEACQGA